MPAMWQGIFNSQELILECRCELKLDNNKSVDVQFALNFESYWFMFDSFIKFVVQVKQEYVRTQ